jgi:hypothetical protein
MAQSLAHHTEHRSRYDLQTLLETFYYTVQSKRNARETIHEDPKWRFCFCNSELLFAINENEGKISNEASVKYYTFPICFVKYSLTVVFFFWGGGILKLQFSVLAPPYPSKGYPFQFIISCRVCETQRASRDSILPHPLLLHLFLQARNTLTGHVCGGTRLTSPGAVWYDEFTYASQ